MTEPNTPAGWYPVEGGQRYWDGAAWTEHFATPQALPTQAPDRDPDTIWEAVGKPLSGLGKGRYRLTRYYLFFEKGTLHTDSQQVPISAVLDVDVKQSMSQKARGVGNVIVHIQRPTRVEVVTMEDIPNFREGQRAINDTAQAARYQIQRNQNTMRYEGVAPHVAAPAAPAVSAPAPAIAASTVDPIEQLAKLGQLRDAGVLTEDEFQVKKAEILGRM